MTLFGKKLGVSGIPVLMYHKIETDPKAVVGECSIRLQDFEEQMRFLCEHDFRTLNIAELMDVLQKKKASKPHTVVLTFDDGHKSQLHALPILKRYGLKASFWVIAGRHRLEGAYLNWREIQNLDHERLFEVGSHSMTHPKEMMEWMAGSRPGKKPENVQYELAESKRIIEQRLGRRVPYFAWPYGYHNKQMIELARKSGYEGLMSVWEGLNYPGHDPMKVCRTTVNGLNRLDVFIRQLKNGLNREPHLEPQSSHSVSRTHNRKFFFFLGKILPGAAA